MAAWLLLLLIVAMATAIWPVGRWALADDGKPAVMGFYLSLVAAAVLWGAMLVRGDPIRVAPVWAAGTLFGIAYSIGFVVLIMYCLKIGPAGPTVAVNNMAMVCGVVSDIVWLRPHVPSAPTIAGLTGVCAAVVMIGLSRSAADDGPRPASTRWLTCVLGGGALSGLSFVTQTYVGAAQSDHGRLFAAVGFLVAAVILAPLALYERLPLRGRREPLGGLCIGLTAGLVLPLTVTAVERMGAQVVLPVTVASPILLMLLIGRVFFGERLHRLAWTACILGSASIFLLAWAAAADRSIR